MCADLKVKKDKQGDGPPPLMLMENQDILKTVSHMEQGRPELVIGFAAETNDVVENARAKRLRKKCDWIVANDVSGDVMGGDHNVMVLVTPETETEWPRLDKQAAARKLAAKISEALTGH